MPILDGMGNPMPANNLPGFNPIPSLFWPCYFQTLQTLLRDEPYDNLNPAKVVDVSFEVACRAMAKIGFPIEMKPMPEAPQS